MAVFSTQMKLLVNMLFTVWPNGWYLSLTLPCTGRQRLIGHKTFGAHPKHLDHSEIAAMDHCIRQVLHDFNAH